MSISRRDALVGASAAVAVAGVPTAVAAAISPSTIEDPVLALKREWDARWKRYESETDESDEVNDPLYDALDEVAYEIFQTPATTPAGIAVKLILWARIHVGNDASGLGWSREPVHNYPMELDNLPVVSALHDLERLAGEARS